MGPDTEGKAICMPGPILTVGHSNRTIEDFLAILQAHGVEHLVDIRTVPRSRHNPQFNREAMPASLAAAGIRYTHMPGLGGLRHARPDSTNTGWRNASFRGYADYMQTPEFEKNLAELLRLAEGTRVAVMCAEAVPWRCHRSLVADALAARGVAVEHLMSSTEANPHKLTSFARIEGSRVFYPGEGRLF
jgi:uncharacterized protein (DUF488 family)